MKSPLLIAAGIFALSSTANAATFRPDDTYRLVGFGDPSLSPDGKRVAVVERHVDAARDSRPAELVLIDVATHARRSLTVGRSGLSSPAWSPSGDAIAFIANDRDEKGQVFVLSLDGGDPRPITRAAGGVQQFAWRPDGSALAYVTSDPGPNERAHVRHRDFFDITTDDYLVREIAPPSHLWLVDRAGDRARRLTSGTWSLATAYPPSPPASPISWSPDGKSILFTRVPTTHEGDAYRSQIYRLDVATGHLAALTGHAGFEGFATYSPDGSQIAYVFARNGDPNNENDIYLTSAAGGPGVPVSQKLDRAFFRAQWFPDGKSLLVGAHDGTRTKLWRLRLDGEADPLPLGEVNVAWGFWIPAAVASTGTIVVPGSTSQHPSELYALAPDATAFDRLTDVNAPVAALELGAVREVTWENNGFHEDGVLVSPPHAISGKRYPLVLYVHGGPQAASDTSFDTLGQTIAARGYYVFEPNYRGSDNLGNAYERAIYMDAGAGPDRDVMAGVAAVEKLVPIDTTRMAVSGWSYGGFMTSWLMAHEHVWRTAISGAAVNDWIDMYDLGDGNVQVAFGFKGSPYVGSNRRDYVAQSPITYAKDVRCPVLVISDVGDVRVPITQSYKMYHALRDNHIPVRFVGIPVDGHNPSDPVRRRELLALWVSWLGDHLK